MENSEAHDKEISWLFDEARSHLDNIENNSKQQKKQVAKDLAKSLEGKIPIDSICIEITNQLRGKISESFVRQCLDDKYKKSYRAENAKKQNKKQTPNEYKEGVEKLASIPTRNPVTKDKKILIDTDGRILFEENHDDKDEDDKRFTSMKSATTIKNDYPEVYSHEHEHKQSKQVEYLGLVECSECKELQMENEELKEALKRSSQFVTADKAISDVMTRDESDVNSNDWIPFAFPMLYEDLRKQMQSIFSNACSYSEIWFSGKVNRKTREVLSSFDGLLPHR
jgi:hypothetical protein